MKKLILLYFLLACGPMIYSQTKDQKTWLTVTLDNNQHGSLFNRKVERVFKADKPSFTVGVNQYLNPSFNFSGAISMGKIVDHSSEMESLLANDRVRSNMAALGFSGVYKFNNGYILKEKSRFAPFIEAGVGVSFFNEAVVEDEAGTSLSLPMAAGIAYRFTENFQLMAKVGENINSKSRFKRFSVGLSFSLYGRPDIDKDGIIDIEDACPQEFGEKENFGCPNPDTDGDGVLDKDDECPLIAGTLNGCPDSDGDGIKDTEDKCPDVFGLKEFDGCPDSDGDGIEDSLDACPEKAGTDGGCPKIELPISLVYFKFASDQVEEIYTEKLQALAKIVIDNPEVILSINGYTDNVDSEATNHKLSKARAQSVREVLVKYGADEKRLNTEGFGEQKPLADNSSVMGRARNRRVEIQLVKKED